MGVDLIKGFPQPAPAVPVNLADALLQSVHRTLNIAHLRFQLGHLALQLLPCFDGRHIDRTETLPFPLGLTQAVFHLFQIRRLQRLLPQLCQPQPGVFRLSGPVVQRRLGLLHFQLQCAQRRMLFVGLFFRLLQAFP